MKYLIAYLLEPISYLVFTLAIFFFSWKNQAKLRHKVLTGYFFVATILMFKALLEPRDGSNISIYDILCLLTSFSISTYFFSALNTLWKKVVTVVLCGIQIAYYFLSNIIFEDTPLFDSLGYVILSMAIVIMIFLFLHQILSHVTEESLAMNFDFWFISSQLIYFLGSFIIFLTFNYLTRRILPAELYSHENRVLLTNLWGVHNVLLFLSSLLTTFAVIWISFRKKLPSS